MSGWNDRLMDITQNLIASPMMALEDWPFWLGFGALEYVSGMIQDAASTLTSSSTKGIIGAITRGGILTMNLSYWDAGHTDMPLMKLRPAGGGY